MFYFKNNLLPNIFSKYFSKVKAIHNYNTRNAASNNYFLQRKLKTSGQKTLQFRGAKYWNELPNAIKTSNHIFSFKKQLKQHLMITYTK